MPGAKLTARILDGARDQAKARGVKLETELVLGSTADRVSHPAHCPVIVVR